jgi:hypothetical protein
LTTPVSQTRGLEIEPIDLNWTPGAVTDLQQKRIARSVSQQRAGAEFFGSHRPVIYHWTRCGTNVLLGRQSRQGDRQRYCPSLDPDGCLARFVAATI